MPFPEICAIESPHCRKEYPVLRFSQNTPGEVTITLLKDDQTPAVLVDADQTVYLNYADRYGYASPNLLYENIEGTIEDEAEGIIKFSLEDSDLEDGGLFVGQITVLDDTTQVSVYQFPCYVEVIRDFRVRNTNSAAVKPLNMADVRLAMRDRCSEDNYLLDNIMYTDHEIAFAMERPLDYWNEQPPDLKICYGPATFPYRYAYLNAIIGELLKIAGLNEKRNNLKYSAAGVSIDDKHRGDFYINASQQYLMEWKEFVRSKKTALNMNMAFGQTELTSFGNYGYGRY